MTDAFDTPSNTAADTVTAQPEPKRDRFGRYLLPDPGQTGPASDLAWTRCTTFAKAISDTYHLSRWQMRMVAKGLAMRPDLFALAAAAAVSDKAVLNQVADDAMETAGSADGRNKGTALHRFTERVDLGEPVTVPAPWDADVAAYRATMSAAGITVPREYIERITVVKALKVAGTFDRILQLPDGRLVIGDLKTQKDFYSWLEIAVQLAVYSRADALWNAHTNRYDPMPPVDQDVAIVMHLPVGQGVCTLHEVDINAGWEIAQVCQQVRELRARKNLARVHTEATVGDPVLAAIHGADSVQALTAAWQIHLTAWTPAHTAAAQRKKAALTT